MIKQEIKSEMDNVEIICSIKSEFKKEKNYMIVICDADTGYEFNERYFTSKNHPFDDLVNNNKKSAGLLKIILELTTIGQKEYEDYSINVYMTDEQQPKGNTLDFDNLVMYVEETLDGRHKFTWNEECEFLPETSIIDYIKSLGEIIVV